MLTPKYVCERTMRRPATSTKIRDPVHGCKVSLLAPISSEMDCLQKKRYQEWEWQHVSLLILVSSPLFLRQRLLVCYLAILVQEQRYGRYLGRREWRSQGSERRDRKRGCPSRNLKMCWADPLRWTTSCAARDEVKWASDENDRVQRCDLPSQDT